MLILYFHFLPSYFPEFANLFGILVFVYGDHRPYGVTTLTAIALFVWEGLPLLYLVVVTYSNWTKLPCGGVPGCNIGVDPFGTCSLVSLSMHTFTISNHLGIVVCWHVGVDAVVGVQPTRTCNLPMAFKRGLCL